MKQRARHLTLKLAMIAIMLLANLTVFSGIAGATPVNPVTVTAPAYEITETTASLNATDSESLPNSEVRLVIRYSKNLTVPDSDSIKLNGDYSQTSMHSFLDELDPGTTYYYYAYIEDGSSKTYATTIKSFTTASFTGIDVKDTNGNTFDKTPAFSKSQRTYNVNVPNDTVSVNVYENFNFGTSLMPLFLTEFAVLGLSTESEVKSWSPTVNANTYAVLPVVLNPITTTICVKAPKFQEPAGQLPAISSCDDYDYEIQITRAAPVVQSVETSTIHENYDTFATLKGTVTGFTNSATIGFELSNNEDMSDSQPITAYWNSSDIYTYKSGLTPGTTYFYRAYAQQGVSAGVYGEIQSFVTSEFKSIDVKNANGDLLTKSPVAFDPSVKLYKVHVPYTTTSVSVVENVYLGTADPILPVTFKVVGQDSSPVSANWSTPPENGNIYATRSVNISSDLTTVCAKAPQLSAPGTALACAYGDYEIQIIRDLEKTVQTQQIGLNTDTTASFAASTTGFTHNDPLTAPTVGFELALHADMSGKQDIATDWSNGTDYLYKYLNDLTPGTTYFYRAYVQEGVTKYDGNIESFTTAKFTGIDVKNESGTPFTKSPSVFAISHKLYTVHVPYNTTSVNVAQNFFLGTAIPLTPAKFAVVNLDLLHEPQTANWNTPVDGNTTASIPVTLASNITTVCMNAPQFQMVSYSEEPITSCDGYFYEVQIIRDAAPSDTTPPPPAKTVTVIVTEHSGSVTNLPVTQLGESKLPMSAQLFTTTGVSLNLPDIKIAADGTFTLPNVPAGQYHMVLNVLAPTGEKLAGRPATLTVDASGNAQVESELIDPYGIITDAFTGNVIEGAHATLHWADTALNRSKGRVPGDLVILPILPDFAPNQNRDPQDSNSKGEYGWMVFPDGDYYIKATKPGYNDFDSRTTGANKDDGDDSYIKNGIIHIGQSIESYDFEMEPIVKEKGTHYNYVAGYPDGTFGPDRNITRAEVAAVFARITNNYQLVLDATDKNSFNDVSNSHWAKEYIENVRESGLMLGSAESTFRPEAPITRGEVAAIVARYKQLTSVEESLFNDTADSWANGAINAVKQANIIDGYGDGTFRPSQNIVRKEFVIMINRMLGRGNIQNIKESIWSDVPVTNFYWADIHEASTTHQYAIYADGLERLKKK